jgi:crossover junction endodeoxyribonuclease RuvC
MSSKTENSSKRVLALNELTNSSTERHAGTLTFNWKYNKMSNSALNTILYILVESFFPDFDISRYFSTRYKINFLVLTRVAKKQTTADIPSIILGIDPGTNVLGYSIIETDSRNMKMLAMGIINLSKYDNAYDKLKRIYSGLETIIKSFQPDEMSVEAPFFGKNVQSMLKLGRAQGVAIAAGMVAGVTVTEYSPKKIKQSITGNGNASKEQVSAMLLTILKIDAKPKYFDATDALAVAVCHYYQKRTPVSNGKKFSGWKDFVVNNPERIK